MSKKILMLLAFVVAVLICTSALIDAHADDTYNFYFQKAPGPVTVNQGAAPAAAAAKPEIPAAAALLQNTQPPTQSMVAEAPTRAEESNTGPQRLELSLGISGSKYSYGGSEDNGYYYYRSPTDGSGMINAAQYTAGLQWNLTPYLALQGEAYYLSRNPAKEVRNPANGGDVKTIAAEGSRFDYGGHLIITPFRLGDPKGVIVSGAILAGAMTVPYLKGENNPVFGPNDEPLQLGHAGSFVYGARLGLQYGRVALHATLRKIDRYSSTSGTAALSIAL